VSATAGTAESLLRSEGGLSTAHLRYLGFTCVVVAIAIGLWFPTDRYLTPQRGVGYALGILGGTSMLALLVYPLRKRIPALRSIGSVRAWFRLHMALGLVGPVCILYHSNFSLGATNSNVALVSMLVVAGSGVVGRYLYGRIHHGLYGRKATLEELRRAADQLRDHSGALGLLPQLAAGLETAERKLTSSGPVLLRPFSAAVLEWLERRRLAHVIREAVDRASERSGVLAAERARLTRAARRYADIRLAAARRVAEFAACERLFAIWHVLHLPLFAMLVVAGIVHVVAVHMY
jgi:hypothetical protein